jgi:DNA-binding transcriptional LysR family regulator
MDLFFAMRTFRRVAELGSFSAAARDLRLSNAAVSKHIATLEERLQTKLINRTTRRMSLTSDGAAYCERCIRILDDVDETERTLSRATGTPRGRLRVNAPMSFGLLHVGPLLPELLARWPELDLDVDFSDRFVDLVEEGVDVAIRIASELPDSATLAVRRLARAQHVLCASPAYLRKHGVPKSPDDLAHHHCLDYSMSRTPGSWELAGPNGRQRVSVQGRLRVNNSLVIRDALLAGVGLARLPSFYVADELKHNRLRAVLTDFALPPLSISAVYPKTKQLSPKVRVFVDFLRERFAAAPWALRDSRERQS